jgi:hypothetical protein
MIFCCVCTRTYWERAWYLQNFVCTLLSRLNIHLETNTSGIQREESRIARVALTFRCSHFNNLLHTIAFRPFVCCLAAYWYLATCTTLRFVYVMCKRSTDYCWGFAVNVDRLTVCLAYDGWDSAVQYCVRSRNLSSVECKKQLHKHSQMSCERDDVLLYKAS